MDDSCCLEELLKVISFWSRLGVFPYSCCFTFFLPCLFFPQAKKFRAFWGSRAELRRFKDGNISETAGKFHLFHHDCLYFEQRFHMFAGCNMIAHVCTDVV